MVARNLQLVENAVSVKDNKTKPVGRFCMNIKIFLAAFFIIAQVWKQHR